MNCLENKQIICSFFQGTLVRTERYKNLIDLRYEEREDGEWVTATYSNGSKKVINVTADSGPAMLRDILRGLEY